MQYQRYTSEIIEDFEKKPEVLDRLSYEFPDRFEAMRWLVSTNASTYVHPPGYLRPGQVAQRLSDWHGELAELCSDRYRELTDNQDLSREDANQDEELMTLQAIRRGVKDARKRNYSFAQKRSRGLLH